MEECRLTADRAEIARLAYLMTHAMDSRNVSLFAACLDNDVEVQYDFGSWRGREAHERIYRATLLRFFYATQHLVTNPLVDPIGDEAKAQYQVHAAHLTEPGGAVAKIGLIYHQTAVRTPEGWRIRSHRARRIWLEDPAGIMENLAGRLRLATEEALQHGLRDV